MAAYFGVIHKDTNSDYGISFPDLPGCISAGTTLDELDIMSREALRLHTEGMLADKEALPQPTEYDDVHARYCQDADFVGVTLVTVSARTQRVRVNISLSKDDLTYIDTMARQHGLDRSGFMLFAAKQLHRRQRHRDAMHYAQEE